MQVRARRGEGRLQHVIEIGEHVLLTDVPRQQGGDESGLEPHDILAASLAACTALTVTLYAQRKGMDLQDIDVRIEHGEEDGVYRLRSSIRYIGNLSAEERERLTQIAKRCPVHRTLVGEIDIVTEAE